MKVYYGIADNACRSLFLPFLSCRPIACYWFPSMTSVYVLVICVLAAVMGFVPLCAVYA